MSGAFEPIRRKRNLGIYEFCSFGWKERLPPGSPLWGSLGDDFQVIFAAADLIRQAIVNLKTAGIAVVFSWGNSGPGASTDLSPANYPESYAVGAVDQSLNIAWFSGRGPSACDGSIFPEVFAPGLNVRTADLTFGGLFPNSYRSVSGTPFSAPNVAGPWRR